MTQIRPHGGPSQPSPSPWSRQSREISRIVATSEVAVVRTAAAAHEEDAKLDAIDHIARRGMQGVALVSQLEHQLGQSVPIAVSRLQAVGDMHALTVASEVAGFPRRLR